MLYQHKYIHFVDFSNPNVSLCDPYCLGLLKQHNENKRPFFYDFSKDVNFAAHADHPSILNRYILEKNNSQAANFSLFNGEVMFEKAKFDADYIDHYKADTNHMKFRVGLSQLLMKKKIELKGNKPQKNSFLPMDTYVPVVYFRDPDLFLRRYNFAHRWN